MFSWFESVFLTGAVVLMKIPPIFVVITIQEILRKRGRYWNVCDEEPGEVTGATLLFSDNYFPVEMLWLGSGWELRLIIPPHLFQDVKCRLCKTNAKPPQLKSTCLYIYKTYIHEIASDSLSAHSAAITFSPHSTTTKRKPNFRESLCMPGLGDFFRWGMKEKEFIQFRQCDSGTTFISKPAKKLR